MPRITARVDDHPNGIQVIHPIVIYHDVDTDRQKLHDRYTQFCTEESERLARNETLGSNGSETHSYTWHDVKVGNEIITIYTIVVVWYFERQE